MYGVSRITIEENVMLLSYSDVSSPFMAEILSKLAKSDIVVDMISQTAPRGNKLSFAFTASNKYFPAAMDVISEYNKSKAISPMISSGYSKINLFGEEMVTSVGVAARALDVLNNSEIEISMITTSDLDISILVRAEDTDVAVDILNKAYEL